MFREEEISNFFNGRQFFILTAVLFVVLMWITPPSSVILQGSSSGVCFPSLTTFAINPLLSFVLSVAGMIGASLMLAFLNKENSYVREVTYIFSSSFLLLAIANPTIATRFYDGTLLNVIVLLLANILFGTYQDNKSQQKVYLAFVLLAICCMFQYAFIYLIPVMVLGMGQMRVMGLKSIFAMIFGLVTPYWIATCSGLVGLSEYKAPHLVDIWSGLNFGQSGFMIAIVAFTILLSLTLLGTNALKLMSYKMQTRSYNGFFIVLMLFTIIVMGIDYNNLFVYMPVLNICLSIQIAHTYTLRKQSRRYIPYVLFVLICMLSYAWQVFY